MTNEQFKTGADRYLTIMEWLRKRYTETWPDGYRGVITSRGGVPSRYTQLEDAFFNRYLGEVR